MAEANIIEILEEHPNEIWNKTQQYAGVNYLFFIEYYRNRNKAIAYKIENVKEFSKPKKIEDLGIKSAPQSFIYLDKYKLKKIRKE